MKKVIVGITATKRYLHAIKAIAERIKANQNEVGNVSIEIVLVTDESEEANSAIKHLSNLFTGNIHTIRLPLNDDVIPYKNDAQVMIARMEQRAFEIAKQRNADYFWSLEPDVLPPINALRCLLDTLNFDGGYYDVAMVTYPSQGGGSFLGGRGTPNQWILPDIYEDERIINPDLADRKKKAEVLADGFIKDRKPIPEDLQKILADIHEEIKKEPPKGNIFELNSKRWRKRGWLDSAYPASGKGCILPTDWVGMGCTLLSRRALALADFNGYTGSGTQDLFLGWKKWHPAGLKMSVITHTACAHIVRRNGSFSEFDILSPEYQTEGECEGHLRMRKDPYIDYLA